MRHLKLSRLMGLLPLAGALVGCSTVDLGLPEMALPSRFSAGADIRLTSFEGSVGLTGPTEGPALNALRDQIVYGMVRCSRSGPRLDLEIAANFTAPEGADVKAHHIIGLATWRDPATRDVIGRHHVHVDAYLDGSERTWVNVSGDPDGIGSSIPRDQLAAGEAFVARICENAFG